MSLDAALLNAVTWKIPNALALVGSRRMTPCCVTVTGCHDFTIVTICR